MPALRTASARCLRSAGVRPVRCASNAARAAFTDVSMGRPESRPVGCVVAMDGTVPRKGCGAGEHAPDAPGRSRRWALALTQGSVLTAGKCGEKCGETRRMDERPAQVHKTAPKCVSSTSWGSLVRAQYRPFRNPRKRGGFSSCGRNGRTVEIRQICVLGPIRNCWDVWGDSARGLFGCLSRSPARRARSVVNAVT